MDVERFFAKHQPKCVFIDGNISTLDRAKFVQSLAKLGNTSVISCVQKTETGYYSMHNYGAEFTFTDDGLFVVDVNNYTDDKIFTSKFSKKRAIEILKEQS
jgi:hypothetical protein